MKTKLLLATVLALLAAHRAGQAQIIANGSFESPVVDNDNSFGIKPTSWMWNMEPPPAIGRIRHVSPPLDVPHDGDQYFALSSPQVPCCRLFQTFALANPGTYKLCWFDKLGLGSSQSSYAVAVSNGTVEVVGQTNAPNQQQWTKRVLQFSASAGMYTLEFRNVVTTTAGGPDCELDNVSLEPDLPLPIIANGSFESPVLTNDALGIVPTNWSVSLTNSGRILTRTYVSTSAQEGNQFVRIYPPSAPVPDLDVFQTFTITTPGTHLLRWHEVMVNSGSFSASKVVSVLTSDGVVVATNDFTLGTTQAWRGLSMPVDLSPGSYTLRFRYRSLTVQQPELGLDNVSLFFEPVPAVLKAVASPGSNLIALTLSAPPHSDATNVGHYSLLLDGTNALAVLSATLVNGNHIELVTSPLAPRADYTVVVSNLVHVFDSPGASVLNGRVDLRVPLPVIPLDANTLWKYEQSGSNLGSAWRDPGYSDEGWSNGAPLFAFESSALPEPIRTPLTVSNGKYTFYFRKQFILPAGTSNVLLRLRQVIDDGVVYYLNGGELFRIGVTAEPLTYTSPASRSVDNAVYQGPFDLFPTNLVSGANLLAAEVHQVTANSSDVVFGASLEALVLPSQLPDVLGGTLGSLTYSPATGFGFTFSGATTGQPYRVQTFPSLAAGSWTDFTNFTYTGPVIINDASAIGAPKKFYRAVTP